MIQQLWSNSKITIIHYADSFNIVKTRWFDRMVQAGFTPLLKTAPELEGCSKRFRNSLLQPPTVNTKQDMVTTMLKNELNSLKTSFLMIDGWNLLPSNKPIKDLHPTPHSKTINNIKKLFLQDIVLLSIKKSYPFWVRHHYVFCIT